MLLIGRAKLSLEVVSRLCPLEPGVGVSLLLLDHTLQGVGISSLRRWAAMPRAAVCIEGRKRGDSMGTNAGDEKEFERICPKSAKGRPNSSGP